MDAVKTGKLKESVVRESVKPLFYTRMRLGEFDPLTMNPYNFLDISSLQSVSHRNLTLEAAIKSFVLLKNKNQCLPLNWHWQNIAVSFIIIIIDLRGFHCVSNFNLMSKLCICPLRSSLYGILALE